MGLLFLALPIQATLTLHTTEFSTISESNGSIDASQNPFKVLIYPDHTESFYYANFKDAIQSSTIDISNLKASDIKVSDITWYEPTIVSSQKTLSDFQKQPVLVQSNPSLVDNLVAAVSDDTSALLGVVGLAGVTTVENISAVGASIDDTITDYSVELRPIDTVSQGARVYMVRSDWGYGSFNLSGPDWMIDPNVIACGTINAAGAYTLTADLTSVAATCLTISSSHVSVDGWDELGVTGQHSITGDNTSATYGILVSGADDVNLTNFLFIKGYENAIRLSRNNGSIMVNNTLNITRNSGTGLAIPDANFSQFINGTINTTQFNNKGVGINSSGCNNCTFANNTITSQNATGAAIGMRFNGNSANLTIYNNSFNSSGTAASAISILDLTSSYANISNNTINMTGNAIGISVAGLGFVIEGNTFIGSGGGASLSMSGATNASYINNNTCTQTNSNCVSLFNGNNNTFSNNTFTSATGIIFTIATAMNNTFTRNTANSTGANGHGFSLTGVGQNNFILNNTINLTGSGIGVNFGSANAMFNIIANNTINTTTGAGVSFASGGANNTINNNTIFVSGAASSGIALANGAQNNTISDNSITTTTTVVHGVLMNNVASVRFNLIANNTINLSGTLTIGIYFNQGANNTALNNTILTAGSAGIRFSGAVNQNNSAINNKINGTGSGINGIYFQAQTINFTNITGNIVNVTSSNAEALNISAGASNNTFSNNTFTSATGIIIDIDATANNNTFSNNTILAGTGSALFVRDLSNSGGNGNLYNQTVNSVQQGNSYPDIALVACYDSQGDGYGDIGPKCPYNSTVSANVSTKVNDPGPITSRRTAYASNFTAVAAPALDCTQNISVNVTALTQVFGNSAISANITCLRNGTVYTGCGVNYTLTNNTAYLYNFTLTSGITTTGDNWSFAAWFNDSIGNTPNNQTGQNSTLNLTVQSCVAGGGTFTGWVFPNPISTIASWLNYVDGVSIIYRATDNSGANAKLGIFTSGGGKYVINGTTQKSWNWIPE
jgi:hypothetical protein